MPDSDQSTEGIPQKIKLVAGIAPLPLAIADVVRPSMIEWWFIGLLVAFAFYQLADYLEEKHNAC